MTDTVAIWNMALSHVGNSTEVQSETESTAVANACRRFSAQVVEEVLQTIPWPFAKTRAALGLVATDPTKEWSYSYRYPSDCITALRIVTSLYSFRNPGPQQIIPYTIGRDDTGRLIYTDIGTTNLGAAYLEYIQRVTDPTQFDATFAQACAWLLAFYIAPRVTGGDPSQLGTRAAYNYRLAIVTAQANALNELQPDVHPDAEWIIDREP